MWAGWYSSPPPPPPLNNRSKMPDDNFTEQATQVNKIMDKLRPQLPTAEEGAAIADSLIKNVQDILKKNSDEIIAIAAVAGGLVVLIPALTVAIVNVVGFTAGGVALGSLAAAVQSSVYGGLTSGIFSVLQSFGATATATAPAGLAAAGAAVAGGGGYLAYKEIEKNAPEIKKQSKLITDEADKQLRAAGEGAGAALEEVGKGAGAFAEEAGKGADAFAGEAGKHCASAANSAANAFEGLGHALG
ncbi:hypothetical protein D9619_006715 [Psilocybe cf. subviscida]|uniref:Uncharacterized protein n=1 Tax=Psilocybe cf. subviscida TaxID=2480587 RepID=A0A8H5B4U4_9AGAR|nr:hypothetical protein D9619_006715 [Psilocybe cf. subviscida]